MGAVLLVAFILRNASTSIAGFGISSLGWSRAGGRRVMKMDPRALLAKNCMNITETRRVSSSNDHFQLIGADKQEGSF